MFDKSELHRSLISALLAMGFVALAVSAQAKEITTTSACDIHSLKGSYDFNASGQLIPMIEKEPGKLDISQHELRAVIVNGTIYADGNGNASIQRNVVTQGLPSGDDYVTGTYTVNADCTGKISYSTNGAGRLHLTFAFIGKSIT